MNLNSQIYLLEQRVAALENELRTQKKTYEPSLRMRLEKIAYMWEGNRSIDFRDVTDENLCRLVEDSVNALKEGEARARENTIKEIKDGILEELRLCVNRMKDQQCYCDLPQVKDIVSGKISSYLHAMDIVHGFILWRKSK